MSLLENVKELVSQRKMTVAELERKLDFSQGSIRHWDKTYPGVDKVQKDSQKQKSENKKTTKPLI